MNPSFHRLMTQATHLTRSGDLRAATAAIQAALGGVAPWPTGPGDADMRHTADVVDIEAREVPADEARERADPVMPPPPHDAADRTSPASGATDVGHGAAADARRPPEAPMPGTGQFLVGRHAEAAGSRDYKLYVPPGSRGKPLPLVVMLHGCTQDPDDFAAGTAMNDAALARGFLVLYPAQAQGANPSRCWNWFKPEHQQRGRGEPAILAGMTREVMKRHDIDPARVYVAGLSAGGAMAAILGDAYPDVYTAVGVHSGLPSGSASDVKSAFKAMRRGAAPIHTAQRPPTIVFHGDQDRTVHPVNGERLVAACAGAAAPERTSGRSGSGRSYTRAVFRDAAGRPVAEHWVVHGAGHAWAGGRAQGSYTDAQGPDATQEMLRFFLDTASRGRG